MKLRHLPFALIGALTLAACSDRAALPVAPPTRAAAASTDESGTYLVRFNGQGVARGFAEQVAALGGQVVFAHAGAGVAAVSGLDDARAAQLGKLAGVGAVEPDAVTLLERPDVLTTEPADAPRSPDNPAAALRFARQWHLRAIHADQAWAAGKLGSGSVMVGILDTGIDYLHPDLYGRVNLALSKSFLSAAENARVQALFPGAHEIADLHFHGTHVAATVASNALIAAGVTSKTTLVGLKVCAPGTAPLFQGTCPTSAVLNGILYAADHGIPIINMSLGSLFLRRDASARGGNAPSFLAIINRVMNYATQHGTTIVVAAGNESADLDRNLVPDADGNDLHYPGLYDAYCDTPAVVCVSATGPRVASAPTGNGPFTFLDVDSFASYSNFGRSAITVAAPGGTGSNTDPTRAYGWVWEACSGFSIVVPVCQQRFYNPTTGAFSGFIIGVDGTSMASPHAAGVAALIAADGTRQPAQLQARLQQTADDLGQPGTDPYYGKGRVNAARAVGLN